MSLVRPCVIKQKVACADGIAHAPQRTLVNRSISGARITRFMDTLGRLPEKIVCDNDPELTSKAMYFWVKERGIKLQFIQPGKPTQNPFVESFNGKFREYCLDMHWFRLRGKVK